MDKLNLTGIDQKVTKVDTRLVAMEQNVDEVTEPVNKLEKDAKTNESLERSTKMTL